MNYRSNQKPAGKFFPGVYMILMSVVVLLILSAVMARVSYADTVTIRPDGVITAGGWTAVTAANLNDQSDATYATITNSLSTFTVSLANDAGYGGATINNVTLWVRSAVVGGSGGAERFIIATSQPTVSTSGAVTLTDEPTLANTSFIPAGIVTSGDVDSLEVDVATTTLGAGEEARIYEVWAVVDYTPLAAQNQINSCDGCHDQPPVEAAARSGATGTVVGSHSAHGVYACTICHPNNVVLNHRGGAGADGTEGQIQLLANIQGGTYSKGANFAQANDLDGSGLGSCSDINCHGGATTTTPQWGDATGLNCDGCHGAPPATNAHPEHYAAKGWGATDLAGTHCTECHPDNTAGHSDVTDGVVLVNGGLSPSGTSPAISCGTAPVLGCHNGKNTPVFDTLTPITCTNCHTPGGANIADPQTGLHNMTAAGVQKHDSTITGGCEACHVTKPATHTDGTFNPNTNTNTDRFVTRSNMTFTDASLNASTCSGTGLTGCHSDSGAWSRLWSTAANSTVTTVGDTRCNVCHGQFGAWRAGTSHGETFGTTTSTRGQSHNGVGGATNACEDCHSYPSLANHENNFITVNEAGTYTVTESGGRAWCQGCHSNDGDFAVSGTHTYKQSVFTLETVAGGNDPVGSCTGCHGGGTSGASSANYWPDGSNANAENTGGNNKHLLHMTRLAAKRYGETVPQLLTDNGNGLSDTKQKALCDYCHQGSTNDGDHTVTLPADVFPAGYKKSLWNAADADATYNIGADTCSNIDCHNSKLTTDNTFGWYDAGSSDCTMCHTVGAAGANPTTGLHNVNPALTVSNKQHDDSLNPALGCEACHGMPAVAPASTHMNGTFPANSNSNTDRGLSGLYTDGAVNAGTCSGGVAGAAGCHDGAGDAGSWKRKWSNTADDGGTAPCANCHGGLGGTDWTIGTDNVVGDGDVSHNRDWDTNNGAEVIGNHSGNTGSADRCNTCHVSPDGPYSSTWGNNHGNDQIDMNSTFAYTEGSWNCTSACHTGVDNTNHNLEDSGWPVNPIAGPGLTCTGCHGGGTPAAGVSSTSTHVKTTRGGAFNSCEDCHPGGTKGSTHSNAGQASVVVILNNANAGISYTHDVDTAGGIQNGFVLGGDATTGTTEAEICWNCHIGLSPMASEWGSNTGGTYNYGTLHSTSGDSTPSPGNHLNWTNGFWKSGAGFTYKTGQLGVRPTSQDVNGSNTRYAGNRASASLHATGGTVGVQSNTLSEVRCSYCHDVHNTGGAPNNAPFLRGTWNSNPYKEDGAPRAGVTFADGSAKPTHGAVPRGNTTTTGNGAFQIDQNNGNPNSAYNYATNDGLCNNCHTQTTLQTAWVGHKNAVRGFANDTTAARNIFSVAARAMQNNRTTRPFMGYQGVTSAQALNSDWMGGFRSSDYAANANALTTIPVNGRYNYLAGEFNWGTQGTGLTQISITGTAVNADFHSFSCSKCHNPHASRLPRLMITNCLDTRNNTWDDQFASDAKWSSWATDRTSSNQLAYTTSAQNCHRRIDANGDGDTADTGEEAGWNTVTPW